VVLFGSDDSVRTTFLTGEQIKIAIRVEGLSEHPGAQLGVVFKSEYDQWVSSAATWMCNTVIEQPRKSKEWAILSIKNLCLTPGKWTLYISSTVHGQGVYLDKIENLVSFIVEGSDLYGTGQLITKYFGLFCMDFNWNIVHEVGRSVDIEGEHD